jgi:hypothetical protein
MSEEPLRWSSRDGGLSASYDDAVAAFRAEGPSEAQLARMLGVVGGGGATAASSAALVWKAAIAVLTVATLVAGALWLLRGPRHIDGPPRPGIEHAPPHAAPAVADTRVRPVAPVPEVAPRQVPTLPAQSSAGAKRAPASSPDPMAELQLLQRARRTLATDPARTLVLTEEHARSHARGSFTEEREALAIEAMIGLGQRAAAARRLAAFHARFGRSIHRNRLEALLAD